MSKIKLLLDVVENMHSLADSIKAVADAMADNENTPKTEQNTAEPKKAITLEQIRAVLAEKSQNGKTSNVRELLLKYGVTKLSEIKGEFYAELFKDAEGL